MLTVTGLIPKFGQNPISYIELDELKNAYLTLDITICFKATAENGLILFKKGTVIQNSKNSLRKISYFPVQKIKILMPGTSIYISGMLAWPLRF